MWQDKLKEIIYILEHSDVNEIDVTFLGKRYRVVKSASVSTVASEVAPASAVSVQETTSPPAVETPVTEEAITGNIRQP